MRAESGGAARPPRSRIPSPRARPRSSCCRGVLRSRVRALTGQINRICQYALRNPTLHDNERELTVECGEIGRRTGDRGAGASGARAESETEDARHAARVVSSCRLMWDRPVVDVAPVAGPRTGAPPPLCHTRRVADGGPPQANQSPRTQNSFGRLGSLGADSTEEPRVDFSAACRSEKT